MNEDGTELETLNHIGRQELHDYLSNSIHTDPNAIEYDGQYSRQNPNAIQHLLHIEEDPSQPGTYYGTDTPEFTTHAAGKIVSLYAPPTLNADQIRVTYVAHPTGILSAAS